MSLQTALDSGAPPVGSPLWWVGRLSAKLDKRKSQLSTYNDYYEGRHPLGFASPKFRTAFGGLFEEFADNWCDLVVDAPRERLRPEGIRFGADQESDQDAWEIWQRNQMDAECQIGFTEGLIGGEFSTIVWADIDGEPVIDVEDPSQVYVEMAPGSRRRRLAALKRWSDDSGGPVRQYATLYLPDNVWKFQSPTAASDTTGVQPVNVRLDWMAAAGWRGGTAQWEPRETATEPWPMPNPLGVVPVVPMANKPRLLKAGMSEIHKVIPIQDGVNKLVADLLVASEYSAFRQRWVTGMDIPKDPETGQDIEAFRPAIDRMFHAEAEGTKFGSFDVTDLANFIAGIEMLIQHIASQTRTPPHYFYLRGQFPSGEACAVDTPVPTPHGWTTMGALRRGDTVFDETGSPSKVIEAFEVLQDRPCYRVLFDDGASIVADGSHRWKVATYADRQRASRRGTTPRLSVMTTAAMRAELRVGTSGRNREGCWNYAVPVAGPLDFASAELPVDPYTLGYWLGNGSRAGAQIAAHRDDAAHVEARVVGAGYSVCSVLLKDRRCVRLSVSGGLRAGLRADGLLGHKHIPERYQVAGFKDRLELLRGIMDADGSVGSTGSATIDLHDETLARDLHRLVWSLGHKVCLGEAAASGSFLPAPGRRWRLSWTPSDVVFSLERKASRQRVRDEGAARWRMVVAVEAVPSVPVRCIQVAAPSHLFLVGHACVPTHNSIKSAETGLVAKTRDKMVVLGEGLEETMRLCFAVLDDPRSKVYNSQIIWGDPEYRSEAEHIDALVKMKAFGVPDELLWERAGFSPQEIARMNTMRARDAALGILPGPPAPAPAPALPPAPPPEPPQV